MPQKIKKAQVVLAAFNETSHNFSFLLLQTNERRGSFWQNVTGKLEDNETFEEGGLREAIEETQLPLEAILDILNLELRYDFVDLRERQVHEESFLIVLNGKWNVKIDPHEHQSFRWIPINEITNGLVKFPSNFQCLEKSQQILKSWAQ